MFQAASLPIIRSSKLYTQHRVFVELFLRLTAIVSEFKLTHNSGKNRKSSTNTHCLVHSFELLMMGGEATCNM